MEFRVSQAGVDLSVRDGEVISGCLGALALAEGPELRLQEADLMLSAAGAHVNDLHIYCVRVSSAPYLKTSAEVINCITCVIGCGDLLAAAVTTVAPCMGMARAICK